MRKENDVWYVCEYCGARLTKPEFAEICEANCKKERRIKSTFEKQKHEIKDGYNEYVLMVLSQEQFGEFKEYYYDHRTVDVISDDEITFPIYFHCVEYEETICSWEDEFTEYYVRMTPVPDKIRNIKETMIKIAIKE